MKSLFKGIFAVIAVSLVTSCSGGYPWDKDSPVASTVRGQSGRITQGPVGGATVYADSLVAGSGTRFVLDSNEISAITDANGDFQLPSEPSYPHVLVSIGGTDRLTGQPGIQMIAPAGSVNVTPLTTLVALDTTGTVRARIEALMPAGARFDADISTVTSQAAVLLSQSVETAVRTISGALNSGGNISAAQLGAIQNQVMQSVSAQIAGGGITTATLTTPASLATTMQSAASNALTTISTSAANTNITISSAAITAASAAVATSVTNTATQIGVTTSATTTQVTGGEAAVITPAVAANITSSVNSTSTTIATTAGVTTTATPAVYTAPVVIVVSVPLTTALSPESGAAGAAVTGAISATFSEDMLNSITDPASGAYRANWTVKAGTTVISVASVSYNAATKTFSATTAALPAGSTITVTISKAIKSAAGVALLNDVTWSFTTAASGTTGTTR